MDRQCSEDSKYLDKFSGPIDIQFCLSIYSMHALIAISSIDQRQQSRNFELLRHFIFCIGFYIENRLSTLQRTNVRHVLYPHRLPGWLSPSMLIWKNNEWISSILHRRDKRVLVRNRKAYPLNHWTIEPGMWAKGKLRTQQEGSRNYPL